CQCRIVPCPIAGTVAYVPAWCRIEVIADPGEVSVSVQPPHCGVAGVIGRIKTRNEGRSSHCPRDLEIEWVLVAVVVAEADLAAVCTGRARVELHREGVGCARSE